MPSLGVNIAILDDQDRLVLTGARTSTYGACPAAAWKLARP